MPLCGSTGCGSTGCGSYQVVSQELPVTVMENARVGLNLRGGRAPKYTETLKHRKTKSDQ